MLVVDRKHLVLSSSCGIVCRLKNFVGRPTFPFGTRGCLRNSVHVRITLTSRMVGSMRLRIHDLTESRINHRPLWKIPTNHRSPWKILTNHGSLWGILTNQRPLWEILTTHRPLWDLENSEFYSWGEYEICEGTSWNLSLHRLLSGPNAEEIWRTMK